MARHRQTVRFGIRCKVDGGRWTATLDWYTGSAAYAELTQEMIFHAAAVALENLNSALARCAVATRGRQTVRFNFEIWRDAPDIWVSECDGIPSSVAADAKPLDALYRVAKHVADRVADALPRPRKRAA